MWESLSWIVAYSRWAVSGVIQCFMSDIRVLKVNGGCRAVNIMGFKV